MVVVRGAYRGRGNPNAFSLQRSVRGSPRQRGGSCPSVPHPSKAINPSKDNLTLVEIKAHHRQVLQRHPEASAALAAVYQLHLAAVTASKESQETVAVALVANDPPVDGPLLQQVQVPTTPFHHDLQKAPLPVKQDNWDGVRALPAKPEVKQEPLDSPSVSEGEEGITIHLGVSPFIRTTRSSENVVKTRGRVEKAHKVLDELQLIADKNQQELEAILEGRKLPAASEPSPGEEEVSDGELRSRSSSCSEGSDQGSKGRLIGSGDEEGVVGTDRERKGARGGGESSGEESDSENSEPPELEEVSDSLTCSLLTTDDARRVIDNVMRVFSLSWQDSSIDGEDREKEVGTDRSEIGVSELGKYGEGSDHSGEEEVSSPDTFSDWKYDERVPPSQDGLRSSGVGKDGREEGRKEEREIQKVAKRRTSWVECLSDGGNGEEGEGPPEADDGDLHANEGAMIAQYTSAFSSEERIAIESSMRAFYLGRTSSEGYVRGMEDGRVAPSYGLPPPSDVDERSGPSPSPTGQHKDQPIEESCEKRRPRRHKKKRRSSATSNDWMNGGWTSYT